MFEIFGENAVSSIHNANLVVSILSKLVDENLKLVSVHRGHFSDTEVFPSKGKNHKKNLGLFNSKEQQISI